MGRRRASLNMAEQIPPPACPQSMMEYELVFVIRDA